MSSMTAFNLLRLAHDTNTFFFLPLCILDYDIYMKKYMGFVCVQYKCKPNEATNTDTQECSCEPVALKHFGILVIGKYWGKGFFFVFLTAINPQEPAEL